MIVHLPPSLHTNGPQLSPCKKIQEIVNINLLHDLIKLNVKGKLITSTGMR